MKFLIETELLLVYSWVSKYYFKIQVTKILKRLWKVLVQFRKHLEKILERYVK